jgi:ribonuclease Z
MLGTGNPLPDPQRQGPSIAVVVNETPYVFDAGEGIWRGMGKEMPFYGAPRLAGFTLFGNRARTVFLTHLHSDHTLGLPSFILSPWTFHSAEAAQVYGPPGTSELVSHLLQAYRRDIDYRLYSLTQLNDSGWRAKAHEISQPGLVYEDQNVRIVAFRSCHGLWPFPIAYRIETPDRVIAISGDTSSPCQGVKDAAKNADILFHEVFVMTPSERKVWQAIPNQSKRLFSTQKSRAILHTSTQQLARLASEVQPDLLVTYHEQNWTNDPDLAVKEIALYGYKGRVISARDGDIF